MSLSLTHQSHPAALHDRLIRMPDVLNITGCQKSTIYLMIEKGQFPAPVRISKKYVAWPESAVLQWVQDRINDAKKPFSETNSAAASDLASVVEKHFYAKAISKKLYSLARSIEEGESLPETAEHDVRMASLHILQVHHDLLELLKQSKSSDEEPEGGAA